MDDYQIMIYRVPGKDCCHWENIESLFCCSAGGVVWYLPGGDIGDMAEGTDVEVYGFYDCKNKDESNATLQFSTEHKTNEEKPCQPFVLGVFLLLP